jgi:protein-S-isoprenylcysteine O-methyltransferase Ste14
LLGFLVVACGAAAWLAPFILTKHGSKSLAVRDKRARWGMMLQVVAISIVMTSESWAVQRFTRRLVAGATLLAGAVALSWSATRALGRQLRIDAAIGTEHELIQRGPYRVMRHPIYSSMVLLVLGIGVVAAPWWRTVAALVLAVTGTEIRVKIEDRLLKERFAEAFEQFQRSTPAYLPPVR